MTNLIIKAGDFFFNSKPISKIIKNGLIFIIGLACGYVWAWKALS